MTLFLRAILLAVFAVASGAAYGATAGAVFAGEPEIGAGFGIPVGVLSGAFVVPLLLRTRLHLSMPFAFLTTLIMCMVAGFAGPLSALAGLATLICVCAGCWQHLKDPRFYPQAGHCPKCNYSLTGLPTPICPECGTTVHPAHPDTTAEASVPDTPPTLR